MASLKSAESIGADNKTTTAAKKKKTISFKDDNNLGSMPQTPYTQQ